MKKIYYLSTCDTNKRILKELNLPKDFIKQDLKTNPVSEKELDQLITMMKKSSKPIFYTGGGVINSGPNAE